MIRRLFKSDAGTSIIEFAVVTPVLLFLLIGGIDLGRSMYLGILAANAARAGASYGSYNLQSAADNTGMASAATTDAPGASWNPPSVTPLCSVSGGTPAPCTVSSTGPPVNTVYYVQVIVTGSFATLVKYPGLPSRISVSGTSVMRVVNQ